MLLLTAVLVLGLAAPALAQNAPGLVISSPDVSAFPEVSFYLEASNESGTALVDVKGEELTVIEDGQELPVDSIEQIQPGLQIILAFNAGGGMAYSYQDTTRFQLIKQSLLDWIARQPAQAPDVYHLITNTGEPVKRLQSAAAVFSALQVYQPDLLNAFPASSTLTAALDTAAEPLLASNMKRSILLITALPKGEALDALAGQIERAAQLNVRVNVWLVGGEEVGESFAAAQLQELASRTGGNYQFFSGPEGLPSPEDYLAPLRYVYQVHYRSAITQAGSYVLKVVLRRSGQELPSNERTFQVLFSLPSPIFLNLPGRVDLSLLSLGKDWQRFFQAAPATVPVQILIEFPDGINRAVQQSRLFVDGALVAENDTAPFDRFTWSPEPATQTRIYNLRVEVQDEHGLVGSSIETPLEVGLAQVVSVPSLLTPLEEILRIAGVVGVLFLLGLMGWFIARRDRRREAAQARAALAARTRPLDRGSVEHMPLFSRGAPARLVRLNEEGSPLPGSQIPLQRREITLGNDAHKAMLVFDSPTVGALHARLSHDGAVFLIADAGSVAGTWLNGRLVTGKQPLQHGDLIQLGRVKLRFELTQVKNLPQVQVLPYTEPK